MNELKTTCTLEDQIHTDTIITLVLIQISTCCINGISQSVKALHTESISSAISLPSSWGLDVTHDNFISHIWPITSPFSERLCSFYQCATAKKLITFFMFLGNVLDINTDCISKLTTYFICLTYNICSCNKMSAWRNLIAFLWLCLDTLSTQWGWRKNCCLV